MSTVEISNKKTDKLSENKRRTDPSLKNRMAGQSCTILLYPLNNNVEEGEIESFVKRAALSTPLRIELFKFQSCCNDYNSYCYVTFSSSADCWLVKKHLNNKSFENDDDDHKISITFSVIPRSDLQGKTKIVEFGTNYPPITQRDEIIKFLNNFNDEINKNEDEDLSSINSPIFIKPAPGHGGIKGKWWLTYKTPEIATKALEFYSGRYFFDEENNKKRFIIINYQLHPNKTPFDRKECFFGITDRIILRNLYRNIIDNDDILLFLQSNGFDVNKQILDIYIIHQMTNIMQLKSNKSKKSLSNKRKIKPKKGYVIITFATNKLATKAYTNLNNKIIAQNCKITTGFTSPNMNDPLKKILKDETNVIHLSNLPWNVTKEQIKEWLSKAGKQYIKHDEDDENEDDDLKKDGNPFYTIGGDKFDTYPIEIYIKYRNGYSTGRAVMSLLI